MRPIKLGRAAVISRTFTTVPRWICQNSYRDRDAGATNSYLTRQGEKIRGQKAKLSKFDLVHTKYWFDMTKFTVPI
jgi:hypothetical protein